MQTFRGTTRLPPQPPILSARGPDLPRRRAAARQQPLLAARPAGAASAVARGDGLGHVCGRGGSRRRAGRHV